MAKLRSNLEWRAWGRKDPLYAVATWKGKESSGATPWTDEEFYAVGASDWVDLQRHWTHYGVDFGGTCIEIGCGAGRMTQQLAKSFAGVGAVDVSPEQLERARACLPAGTVADLQLVERPELPFQNQSATAVFTCHVFQHLDGWEPIRAYLREAFRVLRPGGTLMFHLPSPGAHRIRTTELPLHWRVRKAARRELSRVMLGLGMWSRYMNYQFYEAPLVLAELETIGFVDLELRVFPMRSNGDPHSYYFARRPA